MTATYNVVVLDGVAYDVYADIATADEYLNASPDYATWDALTDPVKGRYLITATRILERQRWQGSKTDDDQLLAWPRSGLTYPDGTAVDENGIPQQIVDACCEIALSLALGTDVQGTATTARTEKRLKAGSVEVEYFRGAEGAGYRFPLPIHELIGYWLAGAALTLTGTGSGMDGESAFGTGYGVTRGF